MDTIYDWITVAIFAGLITLFLQRSSLSEPVDSILHYAPPAVGCMIANYFGNNGQGVIAIGVILALLAYIWFVLRPLSHWES
ncbi:MAG: hypothetical protein KGK11_09080 [Sphingomonadales bacterium]|nr:hypothetical protein [Sphingomonadales bacterium]